MSQMATVAVGEFILPVLVHTPDFCSSQFKNRIFVGVLLSVDVVWDGVGLQISQALKTALAIQMENESVEFDYDIYLETIDRSVLQANSGKPVLTKKQIFQFITECLAPKGKVYCKGVRVY